MCWFSCFKPSPSVDPFEAETDIALAVSLHEADIQEGAQLASAIQESSHLRQRQEEEERRRTRVLEQDAQIANGFLYEERQRQIHTNSALEDEQLAKTVAESLKEKGNRNQFEEQVRKDEQLALIVQESLNMVESPPLVEKHKRISRRALLDVDEQLAKAVEESLKKKGKGKQFEDEQVKKDERLALIVQESLNMVESPPLVEKHKRISRRALLDVDEQLAKAVEESLKKKGKGKQFEDEQVKKDERLALIVQESLKMVESPPRIEENGNISTRVPLDENEQGVILESLKGKGQIKQSKYEAEEDGKLLNVNPPCSMCGGCNSAVERGISVDVLGVLWHAGCFCCRSCDKPIAIHKVENHVSNARGNFHKSCYERYCYVCKEKKMRMCNQHHFWEERYCSAHESDGTPRCCSCERLEPRGTNYVMLGDGRWLCLECMDTAVMDSDECQPLHFDMREFFEGLNMKVEKEFPFLLVEKQALNKAEKEEKIDNQYEMITRGICLSEAQTVTSVSKRPRMVGPHKQLIDMVTESQRVVRECEVTAILIIYGLPRLLTGYILAHEMMHAYLRLSGHRNLNRVMEEGICQVLGHMWLESQTYATTDVNDAAASSSSSGTPAAATSKKGEWSDFEKKLVEFCKYQIETDESPVYGRGFKKVNQMVTNSSLQETLKEIIRRG